MPFMCTSRAHYRRTLLIPVDSPKAHVGAIATLSSMLGSHLPIFTFAENRRLLSEIRMETS
jgi:hypothetical protein